MEHGQERRWNVYEERGARTLTLTVIIEFLNFSSANMAPWYVGAIDDFLLDDFDVLVYSMWYVRGLLPEESNTYAYVVQM